ncbi:MAG TPA: hypothetical protein VFD03_03390 [Clostridia bacterium]|nr:hypothetical protein [Clostridia bacterium]
MNIGSPSFLTMLVLGILFCILIKITKMNRDQKGITVKAIKSNKKNPLFTGAAIIIVIILLFTISSGCTAKEPLTTIINNNNASQIASEETQRDSITSKPTVPDTSAEKVTPSEEIGSTEKDTQTTAPKTKSSIKIVHPEEYVTWSENIGGIAKNIPDGYELWILVYSQEKQQYYPYAKIVPQYDEWAIPVNIGFKDDYGKSFDIVAVLADKNAQNRFNNYLNTVLHQLDQKII